jgi:tetratricopeptide (TPR) repeat protein
MPSDSDSRPPRGAVESARARFPRPHSRPAALLAAGVFLLTALIFARTLRNGFVDWDDPDTIEKNSHIRSLTLANVGWMFTTFHLGHYQPLSWLTLALDYQVSRLISGDGLRPVVYHLTNNLLHAANAVLVYLLTVWLLRRTQIAPAPRETRVLHIAALAAALLFALHPLRVESVAWVTERRDVLSSLFLLLTVLGYLRVTRTECARPGLWWPLTLAAYVLSLLSRAMGVTLPLLLLLLDWYPLRRFARREHEPGPPPWRVLAEKIPFVLPAVATAVIAPLAQVQAGATPNLQAHGALSRLAQACYGLVFYLRKTLWPTQLSPIYELHLPLDLTSARYLVPVILVGLTLGVLAALLVRRRGRGIVVAAGAYGLLLAPVLGFVQSGNQEVADRYSYLASIPVMILLAAGGLGLWTYTASRRQGRRAVALTPFVLVVAASVVTWRQIGVWRDTTSLWTHAAKVCPDSSIANTGYGWVLAQRKEYDEALTHLRRAVELQPLNRKAHYNIWYTLRAQGRTAELTEAYRASIRAYPTFPDAHYQLALDLQHAGDAAGAQREYEITVQLDPRHSSARANLGLLLHQRGQVDEALAMFRQAVELDPRNTVARCNVARLLWKRGERDAALAEVRQARALDPNDATARQLEAQWMQAQPAPPSP